MINGDYTKQVKEELPLKQGLKQPADTSKINQAISKRGTSIKTRIETGPRIPRTVKALKVKEELPLKQGLKQR